MYGLEGRKAIVTGAAHGIGLAIAERFVAEGCDVGIFDCDAEAAKAASKAIARAGRKVFVATGDVSVKADIDRGMSALRTISAPSIFSSTTRVSAALARCWR